MAFNLSGAPELGDPLMGFRFGVFFLGGIGIKHPLDFRFQEVSGLEMNVEPQSVKSMGAGNTSLVSPKSPAPLVLNRGMPAISTLRMDVQSHLTNAKGADWNILVSILDENGLPTSSWLFSGASPISWSLSGINASSGQLIIETIKLTYKQVKLFSL